MQPLDCYFVGTESNHDVKLASVNELNCLLCCALLRQLFRLFFSEDFFSIWTHGTPLVHELNFLVWSLCPVTDEPLGIWNHMLQTG